MEAKTLMVVEPLEVVELPRVVVQGDTLACRVHCSHYQVVEFFCELQQNDQ
jgi:hypothetical protein